MTYWEQLETYLFDVAALGRAFNCAALAEDTGLTGPEASKLIHAYLIAQTGPKARTQFVLTRHGRGSAAMWHVGVRTVDVRALGKQTVSDFKRRLTRFVIPTLERIEQLNPRAIPAAEAVVKGMEAGIELLVAMIGDSDDA